VGNLQSGLRSQAIAGYQWLTSIILATQEAEIRRIAVRNHPRKTHETLSQKTLHKKGFVEWLKV
jgi:hypothetical protein